MRYLIVAMLLGPVVGWAQAPVTIRLGEPEARLNEEFSDLVAMRELADGRLLLSDRKEQRLVVADLTTGRVRDISRKGGGPGEFELFVFRLLPLGGDSTLAADMNRWLVLLGDSVIATLMPDVPAKKAVSLWPIAAGNSWLLSQGFFRGGDSTQATLVDLATGESRVIAMLHKGNAQRAQPREVRTSDGRVAVGIGRVPLAVSDAAMLFPDGWVAVARVQPYRVEWWSPDGRWIRGGLLPFTAVRVNEREQAAYAERNSWARGATQWPDVLPPFDGLTELVASPEGLLLVPRLPTASRPETRYDVVDRSGTLRGEIVLAPNQRIAGFGRRSVYVMETDDDGIQRVQRHAWDSVRLRG
jgi:hypothetical protein